MSAATPACSPCTCRRSKRRSAESRPTSRRRVTHDGRQEAVRSGSLVVALFQHATSRALDPQAHIHAILANATLRAAVEQLGYATERIAKHGQFEISSVPRDMIELFSTRSAEIERNVLLAERGLLIAGDDGLMMTTTQALEIEQRIPAADSREGKLITTSLLRVRASRLSSTMAGGSIARPSGAAARRPPRAR